MGGDHFNLHWCHQSGFVKLESSSHPHTCPSPWGDNGFFCVYVCFSHHLNNSNGWISQLCTSGLCLCFSFCFYLPHIDYKTTHPHQCCQFKSDVSRTLQHLLLTWPLQSSTLGPRCIHSHAETCAAQHKLELSLIPALHICFDAVSVVFLGGFSFSFFFATATVERLAHHMTEPQRQPQPTHSCFASRAFCPVSIKSGQRQLELSTKQRITVPVCYTYHGQLLLDKETKHVALATLHWNNCIGLLWENLACAFSKYWRVNWRRALWVNVSYFHIYS